MGAIKWIGGVMGWAFGGVMGGIIGRWTGIGVAPTLVYPNLNSFPDLF